MPRSRRQPAAAPALSLRIRIGHAGQTLVGPGRADLLQNIQATGSIAAAGRAMKMSYKRAWELVEALNGSFASPLVEAAKGGAGGGGARLTALGGEVLQAFRDLEKAAARAGAKPLAKLGAALPVPPPADLG